MDDVPEDQVSDGAFADDGASAMNELDEEALSGLVDALASMSADAAARADDNNWIVMLLFVLFAVVAGLLWPQALVGRTREEIATLKAAFPKAANADYLQLVEKNTQSIGILNYLVPTIMLSGLVLIGSYFLVEGSANFNSYSHYIFSAHPLTMESMLSGAANPDDATRSAFAYSELSLLAIQSGFLGSFLWSLQHLIRRAFARDITPTTIYRISIHMFIGVIVALMARHLLGAGFAPFDVELGPDQGPFIAVLAFVAGWDPLGALRKILDWAKGRRAQQAQPEPPRLRDLDGIGYETEFRLHELWIEDANSLATANPVEIYAKTPFSLEQAIAWVGQGQLLVRVRFPCWHELAARGFATSLQVYAAMKSGTLPGIASALGNESQKALATLNADSFLADVSFLRLAQLKAALSPAMPGGACVPCCGNAPDAGNAPEAGVPSDAGRAPGGGGAVAEGGAPAGGKTPGG